ncbi:MAG TPA: ribbon-helix-helix domain-containing protein [Jatrophihabitantaceae bacterium]
MKVSVSLSDDDVALIDEFARSTGLPSRFAAVQHAIRLLRLPHLGDDYAAAWDDWQASGEHSAWDTTTGHGLIDAAR